MTSTTTSPKEAPADRQRGNQEREKLAYVPPAIDYIEDLEAIAAICTPAPLGKQNVGICSNAGYFFS